MIRILTYLCPIIMNFIQGGVAFIAAFRFSEANEPAIIVTMSFAVWAAVYCIFSLLMGRITTSKNAARLVALGGMICAVACDGFLVFPGLYMQFLWIALVGIGGSVYCTPFQVFIKSLEPDQSLGTVRADALYTAAWSMGYGAGPFVFGLFSSTTGFLLDIIFSLLIAGTVFVIGKTVPLHCPTEHKMQNEEQPGPEEKPDLVLCGWLWGGIGSLTIAIVRTLLPFRSEVLNFTCAESGFLLFLISFGQVVFNLMLLKSKSWMYTIKPVILSGICGIAGLCLFAFTRSFWAFILGDILYSIYSSIFFFYFVYHSLVHPTKNAKYVSMNEVIVGITGVVGPLLGGMLVFEKNTIPSFMFCGISILLASVAVKMLWKAKFRQKNMKFHKNL